MQARTAVIGGGPAGCAAAFQLKESGREVVLFEKSSEVGGRTETWRSKGMVLDTGAGFFTNFYSTFLDLINKAGLENQIVELPHKASMVYERKEAELSIGSLMSLARFPFVPWRGKAQMVLSAVWATLRYNGLDIADPESLSRYDDCSITEDAVSRLGEENYNFIARPGIEPFWYFSCEEVSRSLYLALLGKTLTSKFYTLRGGMDSACKALVQDVDCRTDSRIDSIEWRRSEFLVKGQGVEEYFDEIILASTAHAALGLAKGLGERRLSQIQKNFLSNQRYVSSIHAAYLIDKGGFPHGRMALFPAGPDRSKIAAICSNNEKFQGEPLPEGKELVSVFLTDRESRKHLRRSEDELFETCWSLARTFWPSLPKDCEPCTVAARPQVIPVHEVGRYRLAARFQQEQSVPLVFAGDYLTTATMDGAMRSGVNAAEILTSNDGK